MYSDNFYTPTFTGQLIYSYAPYNTDQNTMIIEYWSDWNAFEEEFTFHVKLSASIEINLVGSTVYMFFGLYDPAEGLWDYLKCSVHYDGDVNANSDPPSRLYTVTDHSSEKKPQDGALDEDIPLDTVQDWVVEQTKSKSNCPDLKKCTFTCAAKRPFVTPDPTQDY